MTATIAPTATVFNYSYTHRQPAGTAGWMAAMILANSFLGKGVGKEHEIHAAKLDLIRANPLYALSVEGYDLHPVGALARRRLADEA